MKHRWTTLLWELWAAQALCAVAALPPGSAFHTCPALALPGLALAAAVPTAWAAWALLAEPPDGLPPEQLLPALRILIFRRSAFLYEKEFWRTNLDVSDAGTHCRHLR